MTTSTPPPAARYLLRRPNRWPSGRRFRQRHLRTFQIEQRIGSILLAIAASLAINGLAFWQLYTAKPPALPLPEPEPVIVMLGEPDPDPQALTDLAPVVPAEIGEEAAVPGAASAESPRAAITEAAPMPATVAAALPAPEAQPEVAEARPNPAPPAPDAPLAPLSPSEPPADVVETVEVVLPPPEPAVAVTAQDLTDLPAETGEVLAADIASPDPGPQPAPGNAQTEVAPPEPADASISVSEVPEPVETLRPPSLPPDAADQLARVLESPTVEVELATVPPRAAAEPLRALPPQLRIGPERAPLPEPEVVVTETAIMPSVASPPPTLPPETADMPIERADPTRPELVVEPLSPDAPVVRPVTPPVSRAVTRAELPKPERPTPTVAARVAALAPTVAVPEPRRPVPETAPAERLRVDLPLAVRSPVSPPPVALPPTRAEPERVRPAAVAVELPRERPTLAAPAPAPLAALPPAVERAPASADVGARARPTLDREALPVVPQAPTRLDPALLAGDGDAVPSRAGSDADFGLPSDRPGASDGLDWSDSIRAATRDQVAEESAARRAARAPWQRDEAWLADDPPARMQQMLRDDPNLARAMVDFLAGMLAAGAEQTPRTIYKVGPDPGVLIQLWLDRHHGDLQLACRREAAAMPEAAQRVLCPGERTEALRFDAIRPAGD